MRTKNSEPIVRQVLAALFSQEYKNFDLIVVDSGSTDATLAILDNYPHRLICVEPEDYFPGKVLNMTVSQTTTDIVVFLNSDTVPLTRKTLGRLIAAFDDDQVQAAYARQVARPDAETWVRRDYAASFPDRPEHPEWISLSLPLAAMRRSAWQQHPFYTDAWASEDTEWGFWARNAGWKVTYVHNALVMHSHNYSLQQLYGRRFVEGEADAFIFQHSDGAINFLGRSLRSTMGDIVYCIKSSDITNAFLAPLRRLVYHWAYLKGHRHGTARRHRGDTDARLGQRTVLSRHDSTTPACHRSSNPATRNSTPK